MIFFSTGRSTETTEHGGGEEKSSGVSICVDAFLDIVVRFHHHRAFHLLVRKDVSRARHAARGGVSFVPEDARSENPVGTTREAAGRHARDARRGGTTTDESQTHLVLRELVQLIHLPLVVIPHDPGRARARTAGRGSF